MILVEKKEEGTKHSVGTQVGIKLDYIEGTVPNMIDHKRRLSSDCTWNGRGEASQIVCMYSTIAE